MECRLANLRDLLATSIFATTDKLVEVKALQWQMKYLNAIIIEKSMMISGLEINSFRIPHDLGLISRSSSEVKNVLASMPPYFEASGKIFKEALASANKARKRVLRLESKCEEYQLCQSRLVKDLHSSRSTKSFYAPRAYSSSYTLLMRNLLWPRQP